MTTSHILHGSANPIGGQTQLIKHRWGVLPDEMKLEGSDGFIKFALGEKELHFWSPQTKKWVVEPSAFDVWAGGDSTAELHGEFSVTQ